MLELNKVCCDGYMDAIADICSSGNGFIFYPDKNIKWELITIREIDVEGLSERWKKIVYGETSWT